MEKRICEFDVSALLPIGLTIVVAGVGLAYGISVLGDVKTDFGKSACNTNVPAGETRTVYNATTGMCENSTGDRISPGEAYFNSSRSAIEGTAKLPEKLPLLVTVVVAAVIIGVLVRYLMVRYE